MQKGYYKYKKLDSQGKTVEESDWIPNIITKLGLEHLGTWSAREQSEPWYGHTWYNGSSSGEATWDTNGQVISDSIRGSELASLLGTGFIIITDEPKTENYDEVSELNLDDYSARFGAKITGVSEIERLQWDETNQEYYIRLTQQFAPPVSTFTVNTLALTVQRNSSFEANYYSPNSTWIENYHAAYRITSTSSHIPLYTFTTVSPAIVQSPTETLIVSYKLAFSAPSNVSMDKYSWFAAVSHAGSGNRTSGMVDNFPFAGLRDGGFHGGWPTPAELNGPASTTPLTGDNYNIWNRSTANYGSYSTQADYYRYDKYYKVKYLTYTKNLLDTDLGRIRGCLFPYTNRNDNTSYYYTWFNILKPGDNKTQNVYAHSATKTKPFFDATNIANTTGTINLDSSSMDRSYLPQLYRINYTSTGTVTGGTKADYYALRRYITGTSANTYSPRNENLDHPGYYNSTNNWSNIFKGSVLEGTDQWRGPLDRLSIDTNGSTDPSLYEERLEVTLSDGRDAMLIYGVGNDLGDPSNRLPYLYIYDPNTPEILKHCYVTPYPAFDCTTINMLQIDDLSGDVWIADSFNGIYRIQNMLNIGSGIIVTKHAQFSTTFESSTLDNTLSNPHPTAGDLYASKTCSNENYFIVSSPGSVLSAPGYVYIYNTSGSLIHTLQDPTSPGTATEFGYSISISPENNILAVGAPKKADTNAESGKVFIYDLDASSPTSPVMTINNENNVGTTAGDRFGSAVAVYSNGVAEYVAVSATNEESTLNTDSGVVYIYDLNGFSFPVLQKTLVNPDNTTGDNDLFGEVLAITNNARLVVGCPSMKNGNNEGVVYIYSSANTTYTDAGLQTTITSPGATNGDEFGKSLAANEDIILVGAPGINSSEGAVYVYSTTAGTLSDTRTSGSPSSTNFGWSVSIDTKKQRYAISELGSGNIYIYNIALNTLEETVTGIGNTSPITSLYGSSISLTSTKLLVGASYASGQIGEAYLIAPGITGLADLAVNPTNKAYTLELGTSIGGTHRTVWAIIEGALVKSTDQGTTWAGYDNTSTGGVTFTISELQNSKWGNILALIADPTQDRLWIIVSNNAWASSAGFRWTQTFGYWWNPVSDSTSIGRIRTLTFGYNNSYDLIGYSWSSSFQDVAQSTFREIYPSVILRYRNLFGVNSSGTIWWQAFGQPDSSTRMASNSSTIAATRPATWTYGSLTGTYMTNPGNTSKLGTEGYAASGPSETQNFHGLIISYGGLNGMYHYGYSRLLKPIPFTRADGVEGLIRGDWPHTAYGYWDDDCTMYFFPFDNVTYTDEKILDFNDVARCYDSFYWRGLQIYPRSDRWPTRHISNAADPYGVPTNYRRWLWDEYGWNGSSWVKAGPGDSIQTKTVHASQDNLFQGTTISFDDAIQSQIFTANEYHTTGVMAGIWNDNNEEWTFDIDSMSMPYPLKNTTGLTGATISLNSPAKPLRYIFKQATDNDGTAGNSTQARLCGDPNDYRATVVSSYLYDNIAELVSDNWIGGGISTTTSGTAIAGGSNYFAYLQLQLREHMPDTGTSFRFTTSAGSNFGWTLDFASGFRLKDEYTTTGDCSSEWFIQQTNSTTKLGDLQNTSAHETQTIFGLTETVFAGNSFPDSLGDVTYGFRLRRTASDGGLNSPTLTIEILENSLVQHTVAADVTYNRVTNKLRLGEGFQGSNSTDIERQIITGGDTVSNAATASVSGGWFFRIDREGTGSGNIKYYLNNQLIFTTTATSTGTIRPAVYNSVVGWSIYTDSMDGGVYCKKWATKEDDYWVRIGTSGSSDGSFDSNLLIISGRNKDALNVRINGTLVTWVDDCFKGTLNAGECSLFPEEGYLRFSASDSGSTVTTGTEGINYLVLP